MKRRGFTLLELMTVVVILIVLATVAAISYKKYMARARLEAGYGYIHILRVKQEQYFATYGKYVSTTNSPDDYYPPEFSDAELPTYEVPWDIDCTGAVAGTKAAFCDLGFNPGSTVNFGFLTIGWEPGSAYVPNCITDGSKPWWLIKVITFGTRTVTPDRTMDCYSLRATSEHPMNVYEAYCEDCEQACTGDNPCCKQDCM